MVNFTLQPNTLSHNGELPTGYHAMTVQSENRTTADFIRMMMATKGSGTAGEAEQWLDVFVRTFILELSQGRNVNIKGFINAGVSIKGTFPDYESGYDPERNSVSPNVYFSRDIFRAVANSPTNRVSEAASGIFIGNVLDIGSGARDSALTPGNVLKIFGSKIKVVGTASAVGVYFIDVDGEATEVPGNAISRNTAKELNVVVPNLPSGTYQVKVTTQYSNGKTLLAEPRSYLCNSLLTVGT
jgi:hypothetical protein